MKGQLNKAPLVCCDEIAALGWINIVRTVPLELNLQGHIETQSSSWGVISRAAHLFARSRVPVDRPTPRPARTVEEEEEAGVTIAIVRPAAETTRELARAGESSTIIMEVAAALERVVS